MPPKVKAVRSGAPRYALLAILLIIAGILVLVPLTTLIYSSFQETRALAVTGTITLRSYERLFELPTVVINTLIFAAGSTVLALALALTHVLVLTRVDLPSKNTIENLLLVPAFTTPLIYAIAWWLLLSPTIGLLNRFFGLFGIPAFNINSMAGMVLVMGIWLSVWAYLIISATFRSLDPAMEEASYITGAGTLRTLRRITLPVVSPGILSAAIIVFIVSLGGFGVPLILGLPARPPIEVLGTKIFYLTRVQIPTDFSLASSLGVILIGATALLVFIQRRVVRLQERFVTVTGRGAYVPRAIYLGRWRPVVAIAYFAFVTIILILPFFMLAYVSFVRFPTLDFKPELLTLQHYFDLFASPLNQRAFRNTLFLMTVGPLIAIVFILGISYVVNRMNIRGRGLLDYIAMMPVGFPPIVVGFAMLWALIVFPFGRLVYGTVWAILIAYILRFLPHGLRPISSSIIQIHKELEESSRVCGASPIRTFRSIVVPLLKYGIASSWTILFIEYFRELAASITLFTAGSEVISVALWSMWDNGFLGQASALSLIMSAIILSTLFVMKRRFKIEITVRG